MGACRGRVQALLKNVIYLSQWWFTPQRLKKSLQLLQQISGQQPAQNQHIYLGFTHNFWCETVEVQMETGRFVSYKGIAVEWHKRFSQSVFISMPWKGSWLEWTWLKKRIPVCTSQSLHKNSNIWNVTFLTLKIVRTLKRHKEQVYRRGTSFYDRPCFQKEVWKIWVLKKSHRLTILQAPGTCWLITTCFASLGYGGPHLIKSFGKLLSKILS